MPKSKNEKDIKDPSQPYQRPEKREYKYSFDHGFRTGAIYGASIWFSDRLHDLNPIRDWQAWTDQYISTISTYVSSNKNKPAYALGYLQGYEYMLDKIAASGMAMSEGLRAQLNRMIVIVKEFIKKDIHSLKNSCEGMLLECSKETVASCNQKIYLLNDKANKVAKKSSSTATSTVPTFPFTSSAEDSIEEAAALLMRLTGAPPATRPDPLVPRSS